jgi:hypothetical protein
VKELRTVDRLVVPRAWELGHLLIKETRLLGWDREVV